MKGHTLTAAFALTLSLLTACHVGPQIDDLPAAVEPQGANVELEFHKNSPHRSLAIDAAELLQVDDDGILVAMRLARDGGPRLTMVPWSVLTKVTATDFKGIRWKFDLSTAHLHQQAREELRLVSRFPQGLPASLRTRLAATYGQADAETLGQ